MTNMTPEISVVSPVYRAEKLVQPLVEELTQQLGSLSLPFEIILVEDGGPDNSWAIIEQMCAQYPFVKGIKLSRNFGQHYAITAGLQAAIGNWVVVMDCDLQDRPDQIPVLYSKALEGFDLVFARREVRQDSLIKRLSSKLFYWIFSYLTGTHQDSAIANFGIYHKKTISAILSMGDHIRYFPTMSQWVGFRKTHVNILHAPREEGRSSYTLRKLFKLAWDNMIAFSDKPLYLTTRFGLLIAACAGIIGLIYIVKYLKGEIEVLGFTSLMVSIWFLSGVLIFTMGIVGIYVGKTFERSKNRPTFIVEQKINL